jgi:hypothetical protein
MDEVLSERYRLLFLAYEAGGQGIGLPPEKWSSLN